VRINPELLKRLPSAQRDEIIENLGRKDFSPSEMVAIARLLEPHAEALARERQRQGAQRGGQAAGKLPGASSDTRDQLAALVGTSGKTLQKARAVVEAAAREPEYRDLLAQMNREGVVDPAYRELVSRQLRERRARLVQAATAIREPATFDLVCGDCRDVLPTWAPASVHAIITSIPYYGKRPGAPGMLGTEPTVEAYLDALVPCFAAVRRVLREDGLLFVVIGDTAATGRCLRVPWRLADALERDGWVFRADIIWAKPRFLPGGPAGMPARAHEYVLMFSKGAAYFYDEFALREPAVSNPDATRRPRSVWRIDIDPDPVIDHFELMPRELARRCIRLATSDVGCCPRCGAPWRRVTHSERRYDHTTSAAGKTKRGPWVGQTGQGAGTPDVRHGVLSRVEMLGWQPGCECAAGEPVPCTVADPFGGGGTTGVAAVVLGRHFRGVEIDPEHVEAARQRIAAVVPTEVLATRKDER